MKQSLRILLFILAFSGLMYPSYCQVENNRGKARCLAALHFEKIDNLIYLPVSVNGSKPLRFILDGGASVCVIDPSKLAALGLKTEGNGKISGAGSGSVDVTYSENIIFGLTGIKTTVPKVTIINLADAVPGQKIDGLLGFDFFEKYVIEIDYYANTIRLFDPVGFVYTDKGARVPLILKKKLVYIKAKIKVAGHDTAEHEYLVDTGSSDEINDDLVAVATIKKTDAVGGVGIGQKFKVVIGDIETFQIGNLVLKNLKGVSGGQKIGSGLLHNYTVIFDYRRKEMLLE